jgi:hypothetical protein
MLENEKNTKPMETLETVSFFFFFCQRYLLSSSVFTFSLLQTVADTEWIEINALKSTLKSIQNINIYQ